MPKAIGYARVSTDRQAQEGVSLDAQQARIAAWAALNGYEIGGIFVDAGISGKSMKKRPQLLMALASLKKGDALVVYSLSRMARSAKDSLDIGERLEKIGADLVSLSEKIDTSGAAGRMIYTVLAAMAQFERDVIAERVEAALSYKKSMGQIYARVPYGVRDVGEGKLEQVDAEMEIVVEILRRHGDGESLRDISGSLNQREVPTKMGGRWHASTIKCIVDRLKNAPELYRTR